MFLSYLLSGFIPLAPYVFTSSENAFILSIVLSLASLFVLGIISARFFQIKMLRHALEMLILGGVVVGIGALIGTILNNYFGL